jgi:hypothetical protein
MATSKFQTTRSDSIVLCKLLHASPVASVVGVSGHQGRQSQHWLSFGTNQEGKCHHNNPISQNQPNQQKETFELLTQLIPMKYSNNSL